MSEQHQKEYLILLKRIDWLVAENERLREENKYLESRKNSLFSLRNKLIAANVRCDKLTAENERLRNFAELVRDGYDCDSDAHKYGTPCRCCEAEHALKPTETEGSDE